MRVFELAKQLGISSKDLIRDLKGLGLTVSNHMSALEEEVVTQILAKVTAKAKTDAVKVPKAREKKDDKAHVSVVKTKGTSTRAAVSVKSVSAPAEPVKV